MGAGGRPRKPTELLELNGGYREDRHGNRSDSSLIALPKDTILEAPKKYSAAAKHAWESIVPKLILQGILSTEDFPTLEMMFNAFEEYEKAKKAIAKFDKQNPDLFDSETINNRRKLNAWLLASITDFNKLASKFGLSPVDRARIITPQEKKKNEDPLEIIIAG